MKTRSGCKYPKPMSKDSFVKSNYSKRRRSSSNNGVTIMDLPLVIMVEILSRLPIKTVFISKCVCKVWYNLFSDPLFLKTYRERPPSPCILLSHGQSDGSLLELKADYDSDHIVFKRGVHLPVLPTMSAVRIPGRRGFCPVPQNLTLVGLCMGFICLLNGHEYSVDHSIYISNPLLGEYFKIKLPERESGVRANAYAFSFSEASGKYKVLRSVTRTLPYCFELEVYTLGVDEEWRTVCETPCSIQQFFGNVFVTGAIHWIDFRSPQESIVICSFNVEKEKLQMLLAPPISRTSPFSVMLVELGDCLCLSDYSCSQHVDIWWMKEYGVAESWTRDRISIELIPYDIHYHRLLPRLMWKDGEILMQIYRGGQLFSYIPKEKKFRKVHYHGGIEATRYVPSFYSLKTIVGESIQVSRLRHKARIV